MKSLALIAIIVFFIFLGPFLAIWSLNTLFPALVIPYTIETWCAALILSGIFKAQVKSNG